MRGIMIPHTITPEIPPPQQPASISALIKALGGRQAVAALIGKTASSVSNWLADGIPTKHFKALVSYGRSAKPPMPWLTHDFLDRLNDSRSAHTGLDQEGENDLAA